MERHFSDRAQIIAAGFMPGWHHEPAELASQAVVFTTDGWQQGLIVGISPSFLFVRVLVGGIPRIPMIIRAGRIEAKYGSALYVSPRSSVLASRVPDPGAVCSVSTRLSGQPCGKRAYVSLTDSDGGRFHECFTHSAHLEMPHRWR